ncbi:MAG: hypothetical protein IRZ16_05680 [Myxococcaceae bacterium]|nr:hypothetical protein [Myxococcaceae bacterium]
MAKQPGYLRAAFLVPANLFGLLAATLSSVLMADPLPALVALGMEGVYLGTLSLSPRFQRLVRSQSPAEQEPSAETVALLEELAASQREHYFALKELRDKILVNYRKLPGGGVLVASSEPRLDSLLTNFLRLLSTLNAYRKYLNAADRAALERELADLRGELAGETNPKLRDVKEKRVQILELRLQRFIQAEESREIVSHQLASIEDLLRLTHEQSISIRDVDAVSNQLDALSAEIAATDETVREMEKFMAISDEIAGVPAGPLPEDRVR